MTFDSQAVRDLIELVLRYPDLLPKDYEAAHDAETALRYMEEHHQALGARVKPLVEWLEKYPWILKRAGCPIDPATLRELID